ncbi:hypothetical protein CXB49_17870 [Chromobacterium sp. ATCC 53434]|nr:hypothetical protein CXB49_17870 [Chromobacterium sp. ATCC 53434]
MKKRLALERGYLIKQGKGFLSQIFMITISILICMTKGCVFVCGMHLGLTFFLLIAKEGKQQSCMM